MFLNIVSISSAQEHERDSNIESSWKDRVFTGGGLGLQFGQITLVNVAPYLGYKFTDKISGGLGVTYLYYRDNIYEYESSIYGGSIFGRYYLMNQLFLHGEYELLNLKVYNEFKKAYSREFAPGLLLGAGYSQSAGGKVTFNLMVLWDILENRYYPYKNPIFRGGISVGI